MIYITGDTHNNFIRFSEKKLKRLRFEIAEGDYVIVCGDFGLLWAKNEILEYNLEWMANLPFTLLWVAGNHENYNMIAKYEVEEWKGKSLHLCFCCQLNYIMEKRATSTKIVRQISTPGLLKYGWVFLFFVLQYG